jgi:DNA-binding NarL/FixJ family response regulator
MRTLGEARDPVGIAFALVTGAAVLAIQEGVVLALACAVAVLAFRTAAGLTISQLWRASAQAAVAADDDWFYPLTAREAEIAELVSQGLTNREIAARLVISERTVDNHVFHVMNKLNVHTRTEIGVWVVERHMRIAAHTTKQH